MFLPPSNCVTYNIEPCVIFLVRLAPSLPFLAPIRTVFRHLGECMKPYVQLGLFRLTCAALATLFIAGILVPNLLRADSASSLSTMTFAGVSVTYDLRNILFASLGEVLGAFVVFLVTFRTFAAKRP